MIAWLLSEFGIWLVAALGGVVTVAVAYLKGRSAERNRAAAERLGAVLGRKKVDDEVAKMDSGRVRSEYDRWLRDE